MSSDDTRRRRAPQGRVDFTFMYAGHDAFTRDLRRLTAAAGGTPGPALHAGWQTFKNQLHIHHTIEDTALWPPLRKKLRRPEDIAVLDAMEAEHALIDPLLARVDASFADAHGAGLAESAAALADALTAHMAHEEDAALPLVETHLGVKGWDAFRDAIRRRQGMRGAAEFLPWLLDGAPADTSERVLGTLPAPARVLYRAVWRRGYARTPRWTTA